MVSFSSGIWPVALGVALLGALLWLLFRRSREPDAARRIEALFCEVAAARQASESVDRRFDEMRRAVEERVGGVEQTVALGQSKVSDHLGEMREKIGRVFEASQRIEKLATEITRLEDLLKPPKLRGTLGETFLEQALAQVLPPRSWTMQYRFPDGVVVDAAISIGERLVPVDSKFPLENYRRSKEAPEEAERRRARREFSSDVRRHVDTIRERYIRPDAGTYEFALMYVPAEAIYCEIAGDGEEAALADYAIERRVIPVSPRLLYAYLSTIALGLRGLELQQNAQEIHRKLSDLTRLWDRVEGPFRKLGGHLNNAQRQYEESSKPFDRLGDRLTGISESAEETLEADAPAASLLPPS